jgi:hypothetical protein
MTNMDLGNLPIFALIMVIIGLVFAYEGYNFHKLVVNLAMFALGYYLVTKIGGPYIESERLLFVLGLLGGFVMALVGLNIEKVAIFLGVAYLAYGSIGIYVANLGLSPILLTIIQLALALIVGALAVLFFKHAMIIATGIGGASLVKYYLPILIPAIPSIVVLIIVIIIAVTGIIYQYKTN